LTTIKKAGMGFQKSSHVRTFRSAKCGDERERREEQSILHINFKKAINGLTQPEPEERENRSSGQLGIKKQRVRGAGKVWKGNVARSRVDRGELKGAEKERWGWEQREGEVGGGGKDGKGGYRDVGSGKGDKKGIEGYESGGCSLVE